MTQNPPPGWQPPGPQGPQQPPTPPPWGPAPQQPQWGAAPPPQWGSPPHQQPPAPYPAHPQAPVKKKSKAPAIVAGVVALALVVGGVLAVSFFRGATPAAAEGLPDNVLMAVELNLAPAPADQLALARIINKFPLGEEMSETTDYKRALWDLLPDDTGEKPDYTSEVEPWLGNSIAIGFLDAGPDSYSRMGDQVVVAVETTDRRKAEEFAAEHASEYNEYFFVDDVLVITSDDSGLDAASIEAASLADNDSYRADMARLGRGSLASVWLGPAAFDVLLEEGTAGMYAGELDSLHGTHGAVGVKVSDNRVTLDTHFRAPNFAQPELDDIRAFASELPGDALAAMAASASTESYVQSWGYLDDAGLTGDLAYLGITSAADLEALLGHQMGVAIGMDAAGEPTIAAKLVSNDPARQRELVDNLKEQLLPQDGPAPLIIEQDGDTLYIVYGQSLESVTDPGTALGDSAAYEDVVKNSASSVGFIDIDAITQLPLYREMAQDPYSGDVTQWLEPVKTIGTTATADDDGYGSAQIEVTFN